MGVGGIVALVLWGKLALTIATLASPPRALRFESVDGRELVDSPRCDGAAIVTHGTVWTTCETQQGSDQVLAHIDLARGVARVSEPFGVVCTPSAVVRDRDGGLVF